MSQREAKRYVDRIDKDPKFSAHLKRAEKTIFKHAQKNGYKFTRAEYYAHLHKRWGITNYPTDDKDTCSICSCL